MTKLRFSRLVQDKLQAVVFEIHDVEGRLERIKAECVAHGLQYWKVSHEPLFEHVKMRFRGEQALPAAVNAVEGDTSFHMATLTAARYPLTGTGRAESPQK